MNLKIFKLRSGEEIICQVTEETKTKFKILNPLVFKSTTSFDNHGSYDMTVLRDWLQHTKVKTILLPKNHIALEMDPNDDTIKLYELQLETEKNVAEKIVSLDNDDRSSDQSINPMHLMQDNENLLNDLLSSIFADMSDMSSKSFADPNEQLPFLSKSNSKRKLKQKNPMSNLPSPEMNSEEMDRHGIYVTMMIPSESIMNLITAGLLNPKDLLKMIKEVKKKNRFTGDESDREDFGNKLSDWNPDPDSNDYK